MKKRIPLILEQLEDRIFLDANPLVVADDGQPAPDAPSGDVTVIAAVEPEEQTPEAVEENSNDEPVVEAETPAGEEIVEVPGEDSQGVPVADSEVQTESAVTEDAGAEEGAEEPVDGLEQDDELVVDGNSADAEEAGIELIDRSLQLHKWGAGCYSELFHVRYR